MALNIRTERSNGKKRGYGWTLVTSKKELCSVLNPQVGVASGHLALNSKLRKTPRMLRPLGRHRLGCTEFNYSNIYIEAKSTVHTINHISSSCVMLV